MAKLLLGFFWAGKRFGPTLMIGEEIMGLLAHFDFKVEGNPMIMTRVALLHTILSSTKTSDGYSKLVVKADFDRMKGTLKEKTVNIDGLLKKAWTDCCKSQDKTHVCVAFGRFNVRLMLFLLGKQKYSRDKKEMESITDIVELFGQELGGNFEDKATTSQASQNPAGIENLIGASAAAVAQLQYSHIKVGSRQLGGLKVLKVLFYLLQTNICLLAPIKILLILLKIVSSGTITKIMA